MNYVDLGFSKEVLGAQEISYVPDTHAMGYTALPSFQSSWGS